MKEVKPEKELEPESGNAAKNLGVPSSKPKATSKLNADLPHGITQEQAREMATDVELPILEIILRGDAILTNRRALIAAREIALMFTAARDSERERAAQTCDKLAEVFDDQSRELECDAVMAAAAAIRATTQPDDDLKTQNVESQVSVSALPSGSESSGSETQKKLVDGLNEVATRRMKDGSMCWCYSWDSTKHWQPCSKIREALSLLNGEVK